MKLSSDQISANYKNCYDFTAKLLNEEFKLRGIEFRLDQPESVDLVQSVIGHESVVLLIQTLKFNPEKYKNPIIESIDSVKKSFFPDLSKKRFISINDDCTNYLEKITVTEKSEEQTENSENGMNQVLNLLSSELAIYFKDKLCKHNPHITNSIIRLPKDNIDIIHFKNNLNHKIYLFKKFYPKGTIDCSFIADAGKSLTKKQIIDSYLRVYLDIDKFFPKNFLQKNTVNRASILVKFLVEEILESQPQKILKQKDETLFIKHKLQNIYRLFNYSFNRVLANAYPEIIHPWLHSRTPSDYWQNKDNRVNAVQWLVEEKLNLSPDTLFNAKINRKDFSNNGLSFLFNNYYNSVSSALSETYPHKYPWEIGNVPFSYWSDENSKEAVKWLIRQKRWELSELPFRYQIKEFNRKTFSKYGLATLFEKKFNKNIYNAVSLTFPDEFYPWEFGKVPSIYWRNHHNIFHASKWIASKEGIEDKNIVHSIRDGELNFRKFEKYSIGQVLRKISNGKIEKLFGTHFWKEHSLYLDEKRILRKIKNQNNRFTKLNIIRTLLYGLFAGEVAKTHLRQQRIYRRISQRITTSN